MYNYEYNCFRHVYNWIRINRNHLKNMRNVMINEIYVNTVFMFITFDPLSAVTNMFSFTFVIKHKHAFKSCFFFNNKYFLFGVSNLNVFSFFISKYILDVSGTKWKLSPPLKQKCQNACSLYQCLRIYIYTRL